MGELEQAFQKLTGRMPEDKDIQHLYRIKDTLGLASNDALWQVLIALDYHQSLYEEMPAKIKKAADETLTDVGKRAEQALAAKAQEAQATLTEQVAESALAIAGQRTRQAVLRAARWTAVVAALVAGAAAWAGWKAGQSTGYEAGRASVFADQDPQAVEWAQSYWGRQARVLDAEGLLPWAASPEARMLRDLASRGLVADLWADLGGADPDVVVAGRADVEWLASEAGQQARALSEDGTIDWLASEEGKLALVLREAGTLGEMLAAGDGGGPDLAVVARAEAEWLRSADGQQAQVWSRDGTLEWVGSEAAVWVRSGTGADWIPWTRTLLDSRLLFEDGLPGEQACEGMTEKGYPWRLTDDGRFCEVWQGRAFFAINR